MSYFNKKALLSDVSVILCIPFVRSSAKKGTTENQNDAFVRCLNATQTTQGTVLPHSNGKSCVTGRCVATYRGDSDEGSGRGKVHTIVS